MSNQSIVSIVRVNNDIEIAVRKAIDLIGGMSSIISRGQVVLIKPNFIREEPSYMGTTTNISVIKATIKLVKEVGAIPIVGEASGNQYDTEYIYENLGIREELEGVKILDLDRDEIVSVKIKGAKALKEVGVAKSVLEADFIIGLPLLKTHMTTMVTIGMKNMMGVLPQREKWKMHMSGLHQALVDLNRIAKPGLVIVDGITGMEGLGPTIGSPVQMNLILAGKDVVAVDTVGAAVMGFSLEEVKHLTLAGNDGLGVNRLDEIEIRGENIESVTRPFKRPHGGAFFLVWGVLQYRIGTFLLNRFDYDIRPFLKSFSNIYVAKPRFKKKLCDGCAECVAVCQKNALKMKEGYPSIDYSRCTNCLRCFKICSKGDITFSRKPTWMIK